MYTLAPCDAVLFHRMQWLMSGLLLSLLAPAAASLATSAQLMIVGLPTWPHSRNWGYYPSGGLGLIVLILLVLVLMDRL